MKDERDYKSTTGYAMNGRSGNNIDIWKSDMGRDSNGYTITFDSG